MAFANWIHLKAQSVPSTFNGSAFKILPSSDVLMHPEIPLTPARYVGYKPPDDDKTTETHDDDEAKTDTKPNVRFQTAPSTITPCCCYTFNNKR